MFIPTKRLNYYWGYYIQYNVNSNPFVNIVMISIYIVSIIIQMTYTIVQNTNRNKHLIVNQ